MYRIVILLSIFLIFPISAKCASSSEKNDMTIEVPQKGIAGERITLKINTSAPLPASSFYRVDIECPNKPEGGVVKGEMGYPLSELIFEAQGHYLCIVNLGILTKSSCAGVQYKALGEREFSIEIAPGIASVN